MKKIFFQAGASFLVGNWRVPEFHKMYFVIKVAECNLAKKQKELASMQQMVQTYKQNPKFGNAKQGRNSIDILNAGCK